jgi:glyoxylase-like metal-dependent hydrolase (beta-lactamase superfamily II)
VLISHLHGDHINGIKKPDGSLAFPNAEIKVPAEDWAFWMSDENMAKAPEASSRRRSASTGKSSATSRPG